MKSTLAFARFVRLLATVAAMLVGAFWQIAFGGGLPGDCNGSGRIDVSELIVAVNILLEHRPLSDCLAVDVTRDGQVTIDELVQAVRAALAERSPTPTATPPLSATSTVRPTQTASESQPDLIINGITAPDLAIARNQVLVKAEILNQGDGDAGPFAVKFVYARDVALSQPILESIFSCQFAGLAAGQVVSCGNPSPIEVPIVAAGEYFLGAIVDPGMRVRERDESNNSHSAFLAIDVEGVDLEHLLFRAEDGTTYQVISAVPAFGSTDAESFLITVVAGSQLGLRDHKGLGNGAGDPVCAISGGDQGLIPPQALHPLVDMRRTSILRPSDSARVVFDPHFSGRVTLGGDSGSHAICLEPADCTETTPESLSRLDEFSDSVPSACIANGVGAPCASGYYSSVGFGSLGAVNDICSVPPTTHTTICAEAPENGVSLHAGESIVIIYEGDLGGSGFSIGFAGFALDEDGENVSRCPIGTVLFPVAETLLQASAPFTPTPTPTATPMPTP